MVGTPRFMAPEQILGLRVGPWTDIYAVGAVLYALVTGHDPFSHHRDLTTVLQAQAGDKPPLPSIGAPQAIPEAVERAIMKALEKRPEDRWATAAEFGDALARALATAPPAIEAPPAPALLSREPAAGVPRTIGGGTMIQPPPRPDPATPPQRPTAVRLPGSPLLRRVTLPAALVAAVAAAVVGMLLGVALLGRRHAIPEASHASLASAAPLAPSTAEPALSLVSAPGAPVAPSATAAADTTAVANASGSASVSPTPASAPLPAAARVPRRAPEMKARAFPAGVGVARAPDSPPLSPPPPPPAPLPTAAHRAFGVEE
jgi:hypothetical protein